jgi:hypothetical protein
MMDTPNDKTTSAAMPPTAPARPDKKKRVNNTPKSNKSNKPEADLSFLQTIHGSSKLKAVKKDFLAIKKDLKAVFDSNSHAIKTLQEQVNQLKTAQRKNSYNRSTLVLQLRFVNQRIRDLKHEAEAEAEAKAEDEEPEEASSASSEEDDDDDDDVIEDSDDDEQPQPQPQPCKKKKRL